MGPTEGALGSNAERTPPFGGFRRRRCAEANDRSNKSRDRLRSARPNLGHSFEARRSVTYEYNLERRLIGVVTKLGILEVWMALFIENERRFRAGGRPRPRTDTEITEFMRREFPERDSKCWRNVNLARSRYNEGKLFKGQLKPKQKSYRYNLRGERVPNRYKDPYETLVRVMSVVNKGRQRK